MVKPWTKIDSTHGPDMGLFSIKTNCCRSPRTGRDHNFYVIDFPDWVQIIPITPDGQVVMVRQFRHACEKIFLELPGGVIDKEDASPEETARRELLEETGYLATDYSFLKKCYPQPGILSNCGSTYVATGAKKVAELNLDPAEDIEVVLVDLRQIPDMIRRGEINHGQTVMAFGIYLLPIAGPSSSTRM